MEGTRDVGAPAAGGRGPAVLRGPLSEAEIAETLGIATGTVKSHCSAALSRLTIEIEKQDHDLLMNGGPA